MPPAGTWAIDPARAVVAFTGRASFLAPTISARFGEVAGQVSVVEPGSRVRTACGSRSTSRP